MARNSLAGKGKVHSRLSDKARKNKLEYDKSFQKKKSQVKKRVETNKANRKAGTYGNGDKLDASHTKKGRIVMESQHKNRGRNGKNGKSTLK